MTLISLVITLVLVGLILWAINTFIPMEGSIKKLLNIVVIIFVVIWLLQASGVLGSVGQIRLQ